MGRRFGPYRIVSLLGGGMGEEGRRLSSGLPMTRGYAAYALAMAGRPSEVIAMLDQLEVLSRQRCVPPIARARCHLGLRDYERTLEGLEIGFEQRDSQLPHLRLMRAFEPLHADALDRLIDLLYPKLRRIAHQHLARRRPGESLDAVALANETYLKLEHAGGIRCENRAHFLALCAQIMRRILVDHVRRRGFANWGGGAPHLPLDDVVLVVLVAQERSVEVLALDKALTALALVDPRKSRVVELRHLGGLTIEETAEVLGVSVDTAKRDCRMARAWLLAELTRKRAAEESP